MIGFSVLLCFLHLFFCILNVILILFASSGGFVIYDCVVAFYAVFVNELAVADCIVPSDGVASA